MANMFDYLEWRGDLSLAVSPFNDIDALLLSCLSYADLNGIVPEPGKGSITIRETAKRYHERYSDENIQGSKAFIRFAPRVLDMLSKSDRFGEVVLEDFVEKNDPENAAQFAAVEVLTSDGIPFLSFRGTDDTLIGWKEDFQSSYMTTSAEIMAAEYLEENRRGRSGGFRMGGHSKGGHLAFYAAACSPEAIRKDILAIYDNDGPGYNEEFLANGPAFEDLLPVTHRTVPEDSLIGTLLTPVKEPVICDSSERGVMQHDPTTWEVRGKDFVTRKSFGRTGRVMQESINRWIRDASPEERKQFTDDLFSVLSASGTQYVSHLRDAELSDFANMWRALDQTSRVSRDLIEDLVLNILEDWKEDVSANLAEEHAQRAERIRAAWKSLKDHAAGRP